MCRLWRRTSERDGGHGSPTFGHPLTSRGCHRTPCPPQSAASLDAVPDRFSRAEALGFREAEEPLDQLFLPAVAVISRTCHLSRWDRSDAAYTRTVFGYTQEGLCLVVGKPTKAVPCQSPVSVARSSTAPLKPGSAEKGLASQGSRPMVGMKL
jgi:hypothetical protein